jgi:hypothetical protein
MIIYLVYYTLTLPSSVQQINRLPSPSTPLCNSLNPSLHHHDMPPWLSITPHSPLSNSAMFDDVTISSSIKLRGESYYCGDAK